jgi:hypothetical protein
MECTLAAAEAAGLDIAPAREQQETLLAACTTRCGGIWEAAGEGGQCLVERPCGQLSACLPEGTPNLFEVADRTDTPRRVADPTCVALATGPEGCDELGDPEAVADCRRTVLVPMALREDNAAPCVGLAPPWNRFCRALVARDAAACRALPQPLGPLCLDFVEGPGEGPQAQVLLAVAENRPERCISLDDGERDRCTALTRRDPALCPQRLVLDDAWAERLGAVSARGSRVQELDEPPPFLPWVYGALALAGMLLVPVLLLWGVGRARQVRLEHPRTLLPLLGETDHGRLAYAGWSFVLRPLLALLGGGYDRVFAINAVVGALLLPATWATVLTATGRERPAAFAALFLGLNPLLARVSASAAESLLFALLLLVWVEILLRWRVASTLERLALLVVVQPLLLCLRPEGFFLPVLPLVVLACRGWTGWRETWRTTPGVARAMAGLLTLQWLGAALLFLGLPRPFITPGLLLHNAGGLLADLVRPDFLSPLLALAALVLLATSVAPPWRALESLRPLRHVHRGAAALVGLLLLLWCVQGSEGNQALGSARYLVMLLPALSATLAFLLDGLPRHPGVRVAGIVVVAAAFGPQIPLLTARTNLQAEFDFYREAARHLPPAALLVLPAAPPDNPEFSPESGPMAVLALHGATARWLPLGEAVAAPPTASESFLLLGMVRNEEELEALRRQCRLDERLVRRERSHPDVGLHGRIAAGREVTMGLYRLVCNGYESRSSP